MLLALCVVLAAVVVALAGALVRLRGRVGALAFSDARKSRELEAAGSEVCDADARVDEATRERDEALERVQRARRDAAEVATRLTEATADNGELAAINRELTSRNDELTSHLDELDTALADALHRVEVAERAPAASRDSSSDVSVDGELLWALTLARVDRLWRVSVAAGVDATSPLMTSTALLADAVDIEAAAAREEAGALVELTYDGDGDVDGLCAATTVALVEELVASVVQADGDAAVGVTVTDDAVLVSLSATRDGQRVEIPGPATLLDEDGCYRIDRARRTAGAA